MDSERTYFLRKSPEYKPVQGHDDSKDLDHSIDLEEPLCKTLHWKVAVRVQILFYLSMAMMLLSVLVFVAAWNRTPGELECAKIISPYCE
jgi:hypothetical protein